MADATGKLFDRKARLTLSLLSGSFSDTDPTQNTLVIETTAAAPGLRVVFKVTKTTGKEPNTAEITVYNNNQTSRTKLQQKCRVLLETGYGSTGYARTFLGDVRTADPILEDVNWRLVLRCGDGERSLRFARASESFAGRVKVGDVVRYCVQQMGLALGNSADQAAKLSTVLGHGWIVNGAASTELDRVLRGVGYRYSIQDGEVQILAPGQSLAQTVPLVSANTGLIGIPELGSPDKKGKPPTLRYKTLLMPQAKPGARNRVKWADHDGIFKTTKVVQSGDTWGGEWYSIYESISDSSARTA